MIDFLSFFFIAFVFGMTNATKIIEEVLVVSFEKEVKCYI